MKAPSFWYGHPGLRSNLLSPLGALYGGVGRRRHRRTSPTRVGPKVICVGNLVAGGTGKTPTAIALAKRTAEMGTLAAFLTRGYGGRLAGPLRVDPSIHTAQDVGDEPLLLAAYGTVYVARDRVAGARLAKQDGAELLIMDDGFQNPSLAKDLSLLVVDAQSGFGNGRIIPAGPLRERPEDGLTRADAIVLMGEEKRDGTLRERLVATGLPLLKAQLEPNSDARRLRDQTIVAFAGIGRPQKFFDMLSRLGADLVSRYAFPDHHRYDADDIMRLAEMASAAEATLVTTTKDFARLPIEARQLVEIVEVQVAWADPQLLDGLLVSLLDTSE
ncbi:MAG: tetraacyldisaccharide 4'-kinase [Pseudomonadota bacterium]